MIDLIPPHKWAMAETSIPIDSKVKFVNATATKDQQFWFVNLFGCTERRTAQMEKPFICSGKC